MTAEKPSSRSAIGMLILIFGLTAYVFLAAVVGEFLGDMSLVIQTIYYLIAGLLWIWPVKKLIYWMGGKKA
ncbi:MAG: DUF2842 domain-containing protein [Alphaproteobacteria bacterium]|nr:DUF2842 domain-containing protein [Alphaproteobacteria bacterium]